MSTKRHHSWLTTFDGTKCTNCNCPKPDCTCGADRTGPSAEAHKPTCAVEGECAGRNECPGHGRAGNWPQCCRRAGEYNGFGSGPLLFTCPKGCSCHD